MIVVGSREFPVSVVLQSCTSSTREILIVVKVASENRADLSIWCLEESNFCLSTPRFYQTEIANNLAQIKAVPPRLPKRIIIDPNLSQTHDDDVTRPTVQQSSRMVSWYSLGNETPLHFNRSGMEPPCGNIGRFAVAP